MIDKLRYYAYKILPLVYDESLSYYEVLGKVANKINEIIEFTNDTLVERIRELVSALVINASYDAETETLTIDVEVSE